MYMKIIKRDKNKLSELTIVIKTLWKLCGYYGIYQSNYNLNICSIIPSFNASHEELIFDVIAAYKDNLNI